MSLARGVLAVAAVAITVAAVYFMLSPVPAGRGTIPSWAAHLLLYFVQALVTIPAVVWRPRGSPPVGSRAPAAVAAGVIGFATVLELGQSLVPERETEAGDLVVNVIGVAAGYATWRLLRSAGKPRP